MRDPPVAFTGLGEVCGGGRTGDGGSARRRLAGASALGDAKATGYGKRRKRAREGHWFLLRVQLGRRRSAASTAMLTGGEAGAELGGGAGTGVLQALDLPEGVRAGPARVVQSRISPVVSGGDELKRNRGSPAWRSTAELDGGGARVYGGDCEARCGRRGSRVVFKGGGAEDPGRACPA